MERVREALGDDNDDVNPGDVNNPARHGSGIRHELVRAQRAKLDELYQNRKISDEIRRTIGLSLDLQDGRTGGIPHA